MKTNVLALLLIVSLTVNNHAQNSESKNVTSASISTAIALQIDNKQLMGANNVLGKVTFTGIADLDYLNVTSGNQYASIKLGYDEFAVHTDKPLLLARHDFQYLEITLKDLGNTDWSKVEFRLNDKRGIWVSDYVNGAVTHPDGWFTIRVPLTLFGEQNSVQYIMFPNAFGGEFGIRELKFTGNEQLQWFGDSKYDNAIKENAAGQGTLIFKNSAPAIDEVSIAVLGRTNSIYQGSMPYTDMPITLSYGENKLVAKAVDAQGNIYHSDTVLYTVSTPIDYEIKHLNCSGDNRGSIDVTMLAGVAPYSFKWSTGATSEDISGLVAGRYTLEVTDSQGDKAFLETIISERNALDAHIAPITCGSPDQLLTVSGGRAPYAYSIDGGAFEPVMAADVNIWRQDGKDIDADRGYEDIDIDGQDNVYITGHYDKEAMLGEGKVGVEGAAGVFLARLDNNGGFNWVVNFIGGRDVKLSVDEQGNSTMSINFIYSAGSLITPSGSISLPKSGYLFRFDKNGSLIWMKNMPANIRNVGVDHAQNIYAVGERSTPFFSGPEFHDIKGRSDMYLAKYNSEGELIWAKNIWGRNNETAIGMHVSAIGEVYISGGFESDIYFDDVRLEASHLMEAFVAKYNSQGNVQWAAKGGGANQKDFAKNLTVGNGNVYALIRTFGNNGVFGNTTFNKPVVGMMILDDATGNIKSAVAHIQIEGYPWFYDPFDVKCTESGEVLVTGEAGGSPLQHNSGYTYFNGSYLLKCNAEGLVQEVARTGDYSYGAVFSPLAVTRDNHVLRSEHNFSYTERVQTVSILKSGDAMQTIIDFDSNTNDQVVVRDANGCTVVVEKAQEKYNLSSPVIANVEQSESTPGNTIYWDMNEPESVTNFSIYRAAGKSGKPNKIGETTNSYNSFNDTQVSNQQAYTYTVVAHDACGNVVEAEPYSTLFVNIERDENNNPRLSWEDYPANQAIKFSVYRGESADKMILVKELPGELHHFTDQNPGESKSYYKVVADREAPQIDTDTRVAGSVWGHITTTSNIVPWEIASQRPLAVSYFPNPASTHITIQLETESNDRRYQLTMIDNLGRVVRNVESISGQAVISRGALPNGIYTVILSDNQNELRRDMIVFN